MYLRFIDPSISILTITKELIHKYMHEVISTNIYILIFHIFLSYLYSLTYHNAIFVLLFSCKKY